MHAPQIIAIISRFFEALAYLKQSGQLRGVKSFTDKYGIDRRNLHHSKKRPGYICQNESSNFYLSNPPTFTKSPICKNANLFKIFGHKLG